MLIRIDAAELKSVFKDIKPIFRGATEAALMGFTVENHILYITCMNGVVYEQQIASEHPGPYTITVLYQDLSEILPGRGVVELDLAPLYVGIKCERMSSILQQANGMVSRYKQRGKDFHKISPSDLKHWASIFAETAPVAKSIQREAPILFKPPIAVMKFPSFWLQLPNKSLDTVLSLGELKAVAEFAPTEYCTLPDAIEFRRGSATLAVPRNAVDSCKCVEEMCKQHGPARTVKGGNYLPKIQQFLRSVGPGECRLYLCEDGVDLQVSRPRVQSSLQLGECRTPITTVSTFLEYVQMFFKVFGEAAVSVSEGKGSLRLSTSEVSMLLSIV